jgi:hypothetical protein
MTSKNTKYIIALCLFGFVIAGAAKAGPAARNPLEKAAADVAAATQAYRLSLERVLTVYERDLAQRTELAELRQDLFERGILSRREFEESQKAYSQAQRNVEETRAAIEEADRILTEARMTEAQARLTPLARGSYEEMRGLARFNGPGHWSLQSDAPQLQQFFMGRFGRALPVSAFGQTSLHNQMGFDHRNALDVAVHPDSPEGRTVMDYLRAQGIPFIAAWGPVPGSASGAHIHVGQPSPRISVQR